MSEVETGTRQVERIAIHPSVWTCLALFVCAAVLGAILGGAFRVRSVDVVGTNLPTDAIVQAAGVEGQNVFAVRSDQVVERLSRLVRQIVVSRVDVSFPDRVTVYARLRDAVAAVRTSSGLFALDANGAVIDQVRSTELPVIAETRLGGVLGPGVILAVRYAVKALSTVPNGSIRAFHYRAGRGLTIVGSAGWTAALGFGAPQTMVNRVGTLASLLTSTQTRPGHLQYVDLRLSAPYAKFNNS